MAQDLEAFLLAVGTRVQRVREARGLSRRDLGLAIGSTETSANAAIHGIETGGRATQIDTIFKVAAALNVSPGFLLDGGELNIVRKVDV
jgi:transcriptional regulator with XRE-family HTH domain